MTVFDPEISPGTRVLQAIDGFIVLAAFIGVIIFTASGWNNAASDARDFQRDFYSQVTKTDKLQSEYNKLYSEYLGATGKKPEAASPKSIQGETGASGPRGEQGFTGPRGQTGETGPAGATGGTGPKGDVGAQGSNGAIGATGPQGAVGETGPQGPRGGTRQPGANGSSRVIRPSRRTG